MASESPCRHEWWVERGVPWPEPVMAVVTHGHMRPGRDYVCTVCGTLMRIAMNGQSCEVWSAGSWPSRWVPPPLSGVPITPLPVAVVPRPGQVLYVPEATGPTPVGGRVSPPLAVPSRPQIAQLTRSVSHARALLQQAQRLHHRMRPRAAPNPPRVGRARWHASIDDDHSTIPSQAFPVPWSDATDHWHPSELPMIAVHHPQGLGAEWVWSDPLGYREQETYDD